MKIALFGKMRSGKDTVGNLLIKDYNFKSFGFGDGIGEIIQKYFPEDWAGGKPRRHYQHIGQQLRVLNPDVWVNYLLYKVKRAECDFWKNYPRHRGKRFNVVVTDGRQLNEAKRLKEEGYLIVKVTTPEEIRIKRMKALGDVFTPEQLLHETELQVDLIEPDIELMNDGSIKDLRVKVQKLVQSNRGCC